MRQLSPYEKNQLRKYQIPESKLLESEMPVEYLTGHVNFCGLDFLVNSHVLIPRVETEELVEQAIDYLKSFDKSKKIKIIDLATGSGAIAISISKIASNLGLELDQIATDISDEALEVAQKNAARLLPNTVQNISFKIDDLMSNTDGKFDLITANLPYIPTSRINELDQSVKDFEPHLALDGGNDGFELINKLLLQINDQKKLSKNGVIFLEMDITHNLQIFQKYHLDEVYDIFIFQEELGGVNFAKITWKK